MKKNCFVNFQEFVHNILHYETDDKSTYVHNNYFLIIIRIKGFKHDTLDIKVKNFPEIYLPFNDTFVLHNFGDT